MIRMLMIVWLSCIFSGIFAQNEASITWGERLKLDSHESMGEILGSDAENIFISQIDPNVNQGWPVLEKYDSEFNPLRRNPISIPENDYENQFENLVMLPGGLFLFFSHASQSGVVDLYYVEIDKENLKKKGAITRLGGFSIDVKTKWSRKSKIDEPTNHWFDFHLTETKQSLLVTTSKAKSWNKLDTLKAWYLDATMSKVWEKDIPVLGNGKDQNVVDLISDDNGNAYFLFEHTEKRQLTPSQHSICAISTNQENPVFLEIEGLQSKVEQFKLSFLNPKTLSVLGLFNTENNQQIGISQIQVCLMTCKVKDVKPEFFPEVFRFHETVSKIDKGNCAKTPERVVIKEVFPKETGGIVIVGEKYFSQEGLDPELLKALGNKNKGINPTMVFGDILVASLTKDGELEWTKEISKRQVSKVTYGLFSSFSATMYSDELFLMFNDHAKNHHEGGAHTFDAQMERGKQAVTLVQLNTDAGIRKGMLEVDSGQFLIRPSQIHQANAHELIFFGQHGRKKYKWAKLDLRMAVAGY